MNAPLQRKQVIVHNLSHAECTPEVEILKLQRTQPYLPDPLFMLLHFSFWNQWYKDDSEAVQYDGAVRLNAFRPGQVDSQLIVRDIWKSYIGGRSFFIFHNMKWWLITASIKQ